MSVCNLKVNWGGSGQFSSVQSCRRQSVRLREATRPMMRGKNEDAASEGSARLLFPNSTFANNATYLAVCFGAALFLALNAVFVLAFVEDLSRNEKIFDDRKHGGGGNEKRRRRRRRHRRHDELEDGGGWGHRRRSWRYIFRNATSVELRAETFNFHSLVRTTDGFHEFTLPKRPTRRPFKRAIAPTHPQDDECWERRKKGGAGGGEWSWRSTALGRDRTRTILLPSFPLHI